MLDFEESLKKNIDRGITIWLEPVGDKSKLRNLRGVEIKMGKINIMSNQDKIYSDNSINA